MEEQIKKIREFIEKSDWGSIDNINSETTIEKDLGFTGDDAWDFINDYAKRFNVDCSKFEFGKYFYLEGGIDLINPILNIFRSKEDKINNPTHDLTIEDLAKGILAERLDEEVINS
jgi:acyl carrier protein